MFFELQCQENGQEYFVEKLLRSVAYNRLEGSDNKVPSPFNKMGRVKFNLQQKENFLHSCEFLHIIKSFLYYSKSCGVWVISLIELGVGWFLEHHLKILLFLLTSTPREVSEHHITSALAVLLFHANFTQWLQLLLMTQMPSKCHTYSADFQHSPAKIFQWLLHLQP